MNAQQELDRSFLLDLERAAKGLSMSSDKPSVARLRHLFRQVEHDLGEDAGLSAPAAGAK